MRHQALLGKTLQRTWPEELELIRANPQFKLPVVLAAKEVRRVLGQVSALDHRVCLVFGWFHPAARVKLNRVRALLDQKPHLTPAEQAAWQLPEELAVPAHELEEPEPPKPTPLCPGCHQPMTLVAVWHAGQPIPWPREPP